MTYKEIVTYIEEIPRFTRKHSLDHTREMLLIFWEIRRMERRSFM